MNRYRGEHYEPFICHLFSSSSPSEREVAEILIENADVVGLDLELKDSYGRTPLLIACERGETKFAKLLIEAGCNLNARGCYEATSSTIYKEKELDALGFAAQQMTPHSFRNNELYWYIREKLNS